MASLRGVKLDRSRGDAEREERLLGLGLIGGLWLVSLLVSLHILLPTPNKSLEIGVAVPEHEEPAGFLRRNASEAARRSRLVVPNVFVEPERAEQTIATLCPSM